MATVTDKLLAFSVAIVAGIIFVHFVFVSSPSSTSTWNGPKIKITDLGDDRYLGTLEDGRQCIVGITPPPGTTFTETQIRAFVENCYHLGKFEYPKEEGNQDVPTTQEEHSIPPQQKISKFYQDLLSNNPQSDELVEILIFLERQDIDGKFPFLPKEQTEEAQAKRDQMINEIKEKRIIYYQQVQDDLTANGCHMEVFPDAVIWLISMFRAKLPLKEIEIVAQHPKVIGIDQVYSMEIEKGSDSPAFK